MIGVIRQHLLPLVLILSGLAAILLDGAWRDSVTVDEFAHLPAGITHWQHGTTSAYKVNPPLSKLWAAIPILGETSNVDLSATQDQEGEYGFVSLGTQLQSQTAKRYRELYFHARLPNILLTLLGAVTVFLWSQELYGNGAGYITLALYCLCPNLIAHGHFVTPDIGATILGLLASFLFWQYLRRPSWVSAFLVGGVLGVALGVKFSLLLLYPALGLVWLAWIMLRSSGPTSNPGTDWDSRPLVITSAGQLLGLFLVSFVVVNAVYRFEGTGTPLGYYQFSSRFLRGDESPDNSSGTPGTREKNRFRGTALGHLPVPLPKQFVLGIDRQKVDFERGLYSYLRGEMRRGGWWYYYLYALAIKTPIGTLALLALAGMSYFRCCSVRAEDELALLIPGAVLIVMVSSQTGFNHHLRYVLPAVPYLLIWCGRAWKFVTAPDLLARTRNIGATFVALCIAWNAVSVLKNHPHHLSYFNELVGGPANGYLHLSNSNVDWGQDLYGLKQWLDDHPEARPLQLAYFGCVDPRPFGIEFSVPSRGPTGRPDIDLPLANEFGPQAGWYAISVNFLHGLPFALPDGQGRMISSAPFAFSYFQRFRPVDRVGYSIFIYHVTVEEANEVRREFGLPTIRQ